MQTYRLFGLTFASDFSFNYQLMPGDGEPNFTFTCVSRPPLELDWQNLSPFYTSLYFDDRGESLLKVYRCAGCDVMRCMNAADFFLFSDRIVCHPQSDMTSMIEANFLSAVMAFWLERAGTLALHASAVAVNDAAIVFLSNSGSGKSGLAAALIQAGHALVSDDIVPLTSSPTGWFAQPGFATMRMWPDTAKFFLGSYESLPLVHPAIDKRRVAIGASGWGKFCPNPQKISCLFVPELRNADALGDEIIITPIAPRDAVIELVRYSFAARLMQNPEFQPRRMDHLTKIALQVPMYRLSYPSGFAQLARVCVEIQKRCG